MPEGDVGWWGLAASAVLVVAVVTISSMRRLGVERTILWAGARAVVQLLGVGYVLVFVIDPERPLALAWAWVAGMLVVAGVTVRARAREVPGAFGLTVAAVGAALAATLAVLFGLRIFPLEARTLVPLSGLVVGNGLAEAALVSRRIVAELAEKRTEVEARLALGHPWTDASRPYVRAALRDALVPQLERTKVVGLVALPGAMTGLILAGVDPAEAVRVQVVVMFLVLGATATTAAVVALGLTRRLFTPDHRLRRIDRTPA